MSKLLKISCAVMILAVLAYLQTNLFETVPIAKRFKIYRFEIGLLLSLVLIPASNYIWRRFVQDVSDVLSPRIRSLWKFLMVFLIVLTHSCPYTLLVISKEPPLINILCWLSLGIYLSLLFASGFITLAIAILSRFVCCLHHKKRQQIAFTILLTSIFVSTAFFIAHQPPEIVRVEVPIKKLPSSLEGLRIVLIADLHVGPTVGFSKVEEIVKLSNNLVPDIVILAGDLVDTSVRDGRELVLPLKNLRASKGKFFVSGNHEYHTADVDNWFALLEEFGIKALHNRNVRIQGSNKKADWLCLVGVDDIEAEVFGYKDHRMNLSQAYSGCCSCCPVILIAHQPRAAQLAVNSEFPIDLILSGHTHGGQLLPIHFPVYLLNPYFRGLYLDKQTYIYVTQGSAYYGFPLRFGSHSEITHITLRAPSP